ncbi:MAG: hypothetical protein AAF235_08185, partial [Planctomycetota bacterium]
TEGWVGSGLLSATFEPTVHGDGSVWVRTAWVHLGRLPLPADWVLSRTPPEPVARLDAAAELLRVLAGTTPAAEDPVIALPDGRRVRLLAISVKRGVIELTCRTESDI